jgi:hypothetical protein
MPFGLAPNYGDKLGTTLPLLIQFAYNPTKGQICVCPLENQGSQRIIDVWATIGKYRYTREGLVPVKGVQVQVLSPAL